VLLLLEKTAKRLESVLMAGITKISGLKWIKPTGKETLQLISKSNYDSDQELIQNQLFGYDRELPI